MGGGCRWKEDETVFTCDDVGVGSVWCLVGVQFEEEEGDLGRGSRKGI